MEKEKAITILQAVKAGTADAFIRKAVINDALDMAISALEKQIPKKPVIGYAFPDKLREVMKRTDPEKAETKTDCCPVCGRTLGVSKFVQTQTGLRFGDPHCKRCGQAIDWEEE